MSSENLANPRRGGLLLGDEKPFSRFEGLSCQSD
jgi:hypothetical protein